MITLINKYTLGTTIVYDGGNVEVKDSKNVVEKIDGVGVLTDDNKIVGFYLMGEKAFFIYQDEITEVEISFFKMENVCVSQTERVFRAINKNKVICEINYVPYINPGMILFDAEEDEFDALLIFAKKFMSTENVINMVKYIKIMQGEE